MKQAVGSRPHSPNLSTIKLSCRKAKGREINSPLDLNDRSRASNFMTAAFGNTESVLVIGDGTAWQLYDDTNLTVKVRKQIDATNWDEATTFMDNLGRTVKTQAKDSQGDVFALTCYDNMGRVSKVTNPFRGFTGQTCATTSGLEWTSNAFDASGRPWKVTTPDTPSSRQLTI